MPTPFEIIATVQARARRHRARRRCVALAAFVIFLTIAAESVHMLA